MRESRVYLKFLRESLATIFVCTLVLPVLAYFYTSKYPLSEQSYTQVLEILHDDQNASSKELEANNLVSLLRTQPLQYELNLDPTVKMKIYKDGPFLIVISASSNARQPALENNVNSLTAFSLNKYSLQRIGMAGSFYYSNNSNLFIIAAIFIGIALGLLISLVRHYFRYY